MACAALRERAVGGACAVSDVSGCAVDVAPLQACLLSLASSFVRPDSFPTYQA